jgi:cell division protein FtsW
VIVASASIPEGIAKFNNPYHFIIRHLIFVCLAVIAGFMALTVPIRMWHEYSALLLGIALLLLVAVLFIGYSVNGAQRWIRLGPINIQAAEPAKLFFFAFFASYLVRRNEQIQESWRGIIKPIVMLIVLAFLLAQQPDLGTIIVMFVTTFAVMFLGGANFKNFFAVVIGGLVLIVLMIISKEYRMRRIEAFLDPWADPFGTGYQLTQSLMAYGRGDWFGQGLGNSLQKLSFLPEAHTDFIVAIFAEELGYVGVLLLLGLMFTLVLKAMRLGNHCLQISLPYHGYLAYSIGIWFCFQTLVNIGGSAGMIPSKGLTLPLVSYGGSSLIIMAITVATLVRIDFEYRSTARAKQTKKKAAKPTKTVSEAPEEVDDA